MIFLSCTGNALVNVHAADDSTEIVQFPDPNLKQALLSIGVDTNGDGEISRGEMAARSDPLHFATGLDAIDLVKKGITDLTGLEYAVNITRLTLDGNPITDLTPIRSLTNLTSIGLSETPIRDLSPIGQLTGIRFMTISNAPNLDLGTISTMTGLEFLYLDQSNISDISPLAKLTKLKVLHMFNNKISDVSPLAGLSDLREVAIRLNQIRELDGFSNKPYMHTLWLSDNKINDVSRFTNVPSLKSLELDNNEIRDISSFAKLTSLTDLNLDYNQIVDVSPIANLTKMEKLALYSNQITTINPLAGLTKLTHLYIGINQISDIKTLANFTALKELIISNNPIRDISPLRGLINMVALAINNTQISDISALANLTKMRELNLENNAITDITPLQNLTNLETLSLRGTSISDASPLLKLTKLTKLLIDKNNGSTIAPVVTGVTEGGFYNTDRVITFNRGSAKLNDKPFTSGTTVSAEGFYNLFVYEQSGMSTTVHFAIDKTAPIVTGVVSGNTYDKEVVITFNEGTAKLNGESIGNGATVSADGAYTLIVTDQANNVTNVQFTLKGAGPAVRGVSPGGLYNTDKVITFDQGTATLNGKPFASGGKVSADGVYTLVVTGKTGKVTTIVFTIKNNSGIEQSEPEQEESPHIDISKLKDVSNWAKADIEYASSIGLTKPVQSSSFTKNITREQFSEIAVKLYEALTGKTASAATANPFKDTDNPEILKAFQLGIVKGTSQQQFSPQALITREQLATMLMRVLEQTGKSISSGTAKKFADQNKFSVYAVDAINYMSSIDVIKGITATTFEPKQNASIEQAVIMATRLHQFYAGESDNTASNETTPSTDESPMDNNSSPVPTEGANTLYTFDGSALELYVQKSNPQPDGSVVKDYAVTNHRAITLPAHSAIYITASHSVSGFKNDYYNYSFGGYVLIANHTNKPFVIQAKEIDYSVKSFYRDNMGTVMYEDGTSHTFTSSGPYVRLIAFDDDFDESKEYKDYLDQNMDLYRGDWMTVKAKK